MPHDTFNVSCKIVLYNPEHTKILLPQYKADMYGLIGGHLMKDESPDEAILREIHEEIGINYIGPLQRVNFDLVNRFDDQKIVLAYHGELDESTELSIDPTELLHAVWVPIEDIKSQKINLKDYTQFIN